MCGHCRESGSVRICLTPGFSQWAGKCIANSCRSKLCFFFKLQLLEPCERHGQLRPEGKCHFSGDLMMLIAELNTGA